METSPIPTKQEKIPWELSIRRVIIHRDAFMHGELSGEGNKKLRQRARAKETLSETYNVAQLFDDCVDISAEIAKAGQQNLWAQG